MSACSIPPKGWWCSRDGDHDGPCAARPNGDAAHDLESALAVIEQVRSLIAPRWRSIFYDRNALIDDLREIVNGDKRD